MGPPQAAEPPSNETVNQMLLEALGNKTLRDAATLVAQETGLKRSDVYRQALKLKENIINTE